MRRPDSVPALPGHFLFIFWNNIPVQFANNRNYNGNARPFRRLERCVDGMKVKYIRHSNDKIFAIYYRYNDTMYYNLGFIGITQFVLYK